MIILASGSPRRDEILTKFNVEHKIIASNCEEVVEENLTPVEVVKSLSKQKAIDVYNNNKDYVVLGADTIVTINGEILGKPKDEADAIRMFRLLEGKTHDVVTGVTIISSKKSITFSVTTKVIFKPMTDALILEYINNDYVYDKAGAYAIQSKHATFIDHFEGSYYNVMGLPIEEVLEKLKEFD